jgi:CubicO group peptidase (beta-lactamase class C family)
MRRAIAIVTLQLLSHSVFAAEDLPTRIDKIVTDALAAGPGAGLAVKVVRKGEVIVDKGYGKADLELDVPMQAKDLFRIGSITKQFTAAAIMRLNEKGKLKLDDDVGKLLPDAPLQGKHVTVAQLLTHTSGIKDYTDLSQTLREAALPFPPARFYELLKDQSFDFEPGRKWHYSNSNYYLLGLIVEKVSGRKYRDFLRDEVIARAGLTHTLYCDNEPIIANRAQGYDPDGPRVKNAAPIDMSLPFAAGALCSTVDDLVQWSQALATGKVVSPASYAKMTTPVKTVEPGTPPYGFGLIMQPTQTHKAVGHGGGINGFSSQLMRYPDDGVVIAVLVNTAGPMANTVMAQIAAAVLGLTPPAEPKTVPLGDTTKVVGIFDTKFKDESHKLHVYVEAGKLWLHDDFDGETDLLLYVGGEKFIIPHSGFQVEITEDKLTLRGETGEMSGPRVKK